MTSTFNLAMCYLDGTGVDYIDRHKAYELLEKLAALDHKPSIRVLAGLLKADKLAAGECLLILCELLYQCCKVQKVHL